MTLRAFGPAARMAWIAWTPSKPGRMPSVPRFGHHVHVVLLVEDGDQTVAYHSVVLRDQDANLAHSTGLLGGPFKMTRISVPLPTR
jgi:hypothetical protein